jgi:predicted transcriptional regulator
VHGKFISAFVENLDICYSDPMIDVAEIAIRRVNDLPDADRNRILNAVFSMLDDVELPAEIHPDDRAAVEEGIRQAEAGLFASDEEVAALFARFGK